MPITLQHGTGIIARGMAGTENPTFASVSDPETTTPGTSSQVTVDDAVFDRDVGADTRSRHRCEGSFSVAAAPTYATSDAGVATVDIHGVATHVSDGSAVISATTDKGTVGASLAFAASVGQTTDTLSGWAAGSLAKEACDNIDNAIAGATPATAKPIFSTEDHTPAEYVRNTDCWAASLAAKLTCLSPWNSYRGSRGAGTLITARHMIGTIHYRIQTGSVVRFVAENGDVYDRTILASSVHPTYSPYYPDVAVYVLSSDLPAAITPCKFPPATLANHFGNISEGIASLVIDQEEKALVSDLYALSTLSSNKTPVDTTRLSFHEELIAGDSSNPGFLVIDGELVLLTTMTYGGAGSGTYFGNQLTEIDTLIGTADGLASISTGYTISVADLSAYPTY